MFPVFYTTNIPYICVFMTSSTSHCLCDTLMDSWNVCIYICMSCEIYVVGDGGHKGGNGYVTVNDDIYSEYSGASDTTIKNKSNYTKRE
jgi:hypothetical protein